MCKVFKHAVTIYIMCNIIQIISEYTKSKPVTKPEPTPPKIIKKNYSGFDFNDIIIETVQKTNKNIEDNGWGHYVDIS